MVLKYGSLADFSTTGLLTMLEYTHVHLCSLFKTGKSPGIKRLIVYLRQKYARTVVLILGYTLRFTFHEVHDRVYRSTHVVFFVSTHLCTHKEPQLVDVGLHGMYLQSFFKKIHLQW